MSTGTEIVQEAYRELGSHSVASPATPEQLDVGYNRLMGMLHSWLSWGIHINFNSLDTISGELGESTDARLAIIYNLALKLASSMNHGTDVIVSQDLRINAKVEFTRMAQINRVYRAPNRRMSSTQARGQGHAGRGRYYTEYFCPEEELGTPDNG